MTQEASRCLRLWKLENQVRRLQVGRSMAPRSNYRGTTSIANVLEGELAHLESRQDEKGGDQGEAGMVSRRVGEEGRNAASETGGCDQKVTNWPGQLCLENTLT